MKSWSVESIEEELHILKNQMDNNFEKFKVAK